jgi:hypothetical protein
MNLSNIPIGEILGVKTAAGAMFWKRTATGLDGPFTDRECSIRAKNIAEEMMLELNRAMGRQKVFRGANRNMRMSDGVRYRSDAKGTIRRVDKRQGKKKRSRKEIILGQTDSKSAG